MNLWLSRFGFASLLAAMTLSASFGGDPPKQAADWPQWRGSTRDGQAPKWRPTANWKTAPQLVWKAPVGEGHSSPVIAKNRIFQFSRRGDKETLACFDLAGKELWSKSYLAPYEMDPAAVGHGKGPKSTPAVAGGRVFTLGISGIASGWSAADGTLLWRREFSKDFENTSPLFGAAASPLVQGEAVMLPVGGHDGGAFISVDAAAGKTHWSQNFDGPAYSSPLEVNFGKFSWIVTETQKHRVALDEKSGDVVWSEPFETRYVQNSISPLRYKSDMVIFSGYDTPVTAYRLGEGPDAVYERAWSNDDASLYMSSPVLVGERLVGFSQYKKGQLFALDAKSGKTLWTGPGRQGDNASLLVAGEIVIAVSTTGEMIVVKGTGDQYEELARHKLSDTPIWAHAAPCADGLLVKDFENLMLYRWAK